MDQLFQLVLRVPARFPGSVIPACFTSTCSFPWVSYSSFFYEYLLVSLGQLFQLVLRVPFRFPGSFVQPCCRSTCSFPWVSYSSLFYECLFVSLGRFRLVLAHIQSFHGVLSGCCCPDFNSRRRLTCRVPVREAGLASWGRCCSDSQAAGALRNLHSPLTQRIHTARLLC